MSREEYFEVDTLKPGMMFLERSYFGKLTESCLYLVLRLDAVVEQTWDPEVSDFFDTHYVDVTYLVNDKVDTIRYFSGASAWGRDELVRLNRG